MRDPTDGYVWHSQFLIGALRRDERQHREESKMITKAELRRWYLMSAQTTEIAAILESAFDEDDREGGHFDAIGFSQFCPEDKPEDVQEAWLAYETYHRLLANNTAGKRT